MEQHGNIKPIYSNNVERQQKVSSHKNVYPRYPGEVLPECYAQKSKKIIKKYKKGNLPEASMPSASSSSSSSSSTSTSESEEEYVKTKVPTKKSLSRNFQKHQQRFMQKTTSATHKWSTMVDLGGIIRPTQVTAKFNPKCHILVIKAKQNVTNKAPLRRADETLEQEDTLSQQSGYKTALGNIVRVVPLPENIHLHLLKVQMTPNIHQIIVKAPFVLPGEELKQQQIRYSSKWVPINVTVKDSSMDVLSYHQPLGTTRTPYELDRTAAYQKGYPQEEQRAKYYIPGKQWQTISSNVEGQERYLIKQEEEQEDLQKTSISRLLRPEYIRDPVTGKLAMMIKVNTVGFLPEEVVVRVDQTQRILTVEAAKRQEDQPLGDRKEVSRKQQQVLEQGIPLKYFRREFVLPQWLDVTHIGYRVLQNGLLAIKLPIVKLSKANKSSKEFDEMDVEEHQVKNVDWETPLSA